MQGLEVSHLSKRYGDAVVVDDLSFRVAAGEIFGLIGPNGAGKSTTMMMILGLLKADGGSVFLDERPFDRHNPDMRSWFGVVPQQLAIYPNLSAIQNLRFFGSINGLSGRKLRERVASVLELTGLTDNAH
jgi:ABC-2 type transport system ATP-binding protein